MNYIKRIVTATTLLFSSAIFAGLYLNFKGQELYSVKDNGLVFMVGAFCITSAVFFLILKPSFYSPFIGFILGLLSYFLYLIFFGRFFLNFSMLQQQVAASVVIFTFGLLYVQLLQILKNRQSK